MTFREAPDAAFHEAVAREHLEGGMSIVELHRNHDVPASAVRSWIALYRDGGRAALDTAAAEIARRDALPLTRAQHAKLLEQLTASNPTTVQRALVMIGRRRVTDLADAVFAIVETKRGPVIDALLTLGELGAAQHLDRAAILLGDTYAGWISGARTRARP